MHTLAIVIPAYKIHYLKEVLESITRQTCNNFTVYIGDDASPDNLQHIIDQYRSHITIIYKRFDSNIGRNDLVGHWERCIDMVEQEEWLWLFSDDDVMEPTCVERFYATLANYPQFDLYHFDVLQIDVSGKITGSFFPFPDVMTSEEFIMRKLVSPGGFSAVIEYIFRKSHFLQQGRFINFDLAWGSDDATWIRLAKQNGIRNIPGARIYWRESPFNISPNNADRIVVKRKIYAQIQFAKWIDEEVNRNKIQVNRKSLSKHLKSWLFDSMKHKVQFIPFTTISTSLSAYQLVFGSRPFTVPEVIYLYAYKIYCFLKAGSKDLLLRKDVTGSS